MTKHLDYNAFSKDQFLSRCKRIHIRICENFKEKSLRMIVDKMGFAKEDTRTFRSLKLLDLILKYLYTSQNTGLSHIANEEIIARLIDLKDFSYIKELFALNDIRQLDAHKTSTKRICYFKALSVAYVRRDFFIPVGIFYKELRSDMLPLNFKTATNL